MKHDKKNHLPLIGVGPLIVAPQIILTVVMILLSQKVLPKFEIPYKMPFIIFGILVVAIGVYLWVSAMVKSKIDAHIANNELVTTGVYAWVRNPIYSAFWLVCLGVILINRDIFLFWLPILYWIYMTVFLKKTEEVWLTKLYGNAYVKYCKRVNRCIPWFPKKKTNKEI